MTGKQEGDHVSIPEPPDLGEPHSDEGKVGLAKEARKAARTRQLDLDVRGIIALIGLIGALALSFCGLFLRHNAEIPQWAASMVAAVLGFYFGARAGGSSVPRPPGSNGEN